MIELAPPNIGENHMTDKKNQLKNIRRIVKNCVSEIPQAEFLKVNIKVNNIKAIEKIIHYYINNQKGFKKNICVFLHITMNYDTIVPITAKLIQEKIIYTLKSMTDYENIYVNIYVEK